MRPWLRFTAIVVFVFTRGGRGSQARAARSSVTIAYPTGRMRSVLHVVLVVACLGAWAASPSTAAAAGLEEAIAAYKRGDYEAAFPEFLLRAKRGDPKFQMYVAHMYAWGSGVRASAERAHREGKGPNPDSEAFKWMSRAAEQGLIDAQFALASYHALGIGVERDAAKARELYVRTAEKGPPRIQLKLGMMYYEGYDHYGVPKDDTQAANWIRRAVEGGLPAAQFMLGVIYEEGRGVERDPAQAIDRYKRAADQGVAEAQGTLGDLYWRGKGVRHDCDKAVEWFRKAAQQNIKYAQYMLGYMRQTGQCLPKDNVQAYLWYSNAWYRGCSKEYLNIRVKLERHMSEVDVRRANALWRAWAPTGAPNLEFFPRVTLPRPSCGWMPNLPYPYQRLEAALAALAQGKKREAQRLLREHQPGEVANLCDVVHPKRAAQEPIDTEVEKQKQLYVAARAGDLIGVKRLLAAGADVNAKDEENWLTPLHYGVCSGSVEVVQFLLTKGADINARARWGLTPIHYAAGSGSIGIVELLTAWSADVDTKDTKRQTPLHMAVQRKDLAMAEMLIAKGADVDARANGKETPLDYAIRSGSVEVVQFLLTKGANVNASASGERTPLHFAASSESVSIVELLVAKGADIHARDTWGHTPLHLAVRSGSVEVVQFLLAKGADVDARDKKGKTPLDYATQQEVIELFKQRASNK